jgi:hypothetical protein
MGVKMCMNVMYTFYKFLYAASHTSITLKFIYYRQKSTVANLVNSETMTLHIDIFPTLR